MLILYKKSERQFLSNGIGRLDKHAFDDKVREELNGIYKLEFTYPIHAPHSKDIKNDNIVRATVPDGEQPFFISRIVKKDGYLRVTAYHLFYRLIWQLIEDINIVNLNGQAALNRVLENTEFTAVSDIAQTRNIRIVRYNAVEAILNPSKDNTLLSRFGGELKRDRLTVMLMNRIGRTYENNPVEIRYAKNLLSYEADIDSTNVATRVMPIGFDGLLLPEKYVVKPGADPTDYKTVKVEYSNIMAISNPDNPKEGELPLTDAYEAMRQAVLSDFEKGRFDLKASYQVKFQELSTTEEYKNKSVLEKVYLGDEIKVIHTDEDLQILSRVVAYEWSPIRKEYEEVELGSHIDTFSDIRPTLDLIAGKVEQYKTDWEKNVEEITDILTTALGGHVLKRTGELLIMDTDDPETATKVWRWNLNGLGYSDNGINGPYETAITMDGRIIAKFVYALNLSSISADLGTVTAGRIQDKDNESYWDLDGKEIKLNVNELKILGKNINVSLGELEDGIQGVSTTIKNMSVGGRNIFLTSGNFNSTLTNWFDNGGGINLVNSDRYGKVIRTIVGTGIQGIWYKLDEDTEYTFSAMVKSDQAFVGSGSVPLHYHAGLNSINQGKIQILKSSVEYTTDDIGKYKLLYITFKLTQDANTFKPFIYWGTGNRVFDIAYLKLEKGNIPTDWTRSTEEVDAKITTVSTTVDGMKIDVQKYKDGKLTGQTYNFDGSAFTIGGGGGDVAKHTNSESRYTHSDGSYTRIGTSGMERVISGSPKKYHYLTTAGAISASFYSPNYLDRGYLTMQTVTLPEDFKNKDFQVIPSLGGFTCYELYQGQEIKTPYYALTMSDISVTINKAAGTCSISARLHFARTVSSYPDNPYRVDFKINYMAVG